MMKILFLGDVVGISGRSMVLNNLLSKIKDGKIDFVVVNGENAADSGVGLTEEICKDFFNCGVDVVTTGNHVWDQKETMSHIEKENRLLRPKNLFEPSPGKGFGIFTAKNGKKWTNHLKFYRPKSLEFHGDNAVAAKSNYGMAGQEMCFNHPDYIDNCVATPKDRSWTRFLAVIPCDARYDQAMLGPKIRGGISKFQNLQYFHKNHALLQ